MHKNSLLIDKEKLVNWRFAQEIKSQRYHHADDPTRGVGLVRCFFGHGASLDDVRRTDKHEAEFPAAIPHFKERRLIIAV